MSFIPVMAKLFFQHPSLQKTIIIIENSFETVMIFFPEFCDEWKYQISIYFKKVLLFFATMSMSHYTFFF